MRLAYCELNAKTGHAAGLGLLEELYREETGKDLPEIQKTSRGKPYFPGNPYYFSISHTKKHCFCVLSKHPCAIDAEEQSRECRSGLAEKILSPMEYEQYLSAKDKQAALLKFWVLKEAAAKLSGEGLRGFPNHTNFSLNDPRISILEGCYLAIFEEKED